MCWNFNILLFFLFVGLSLGSLDCFVLLCVVVLILKVFCDCKEFYLMLLIIIWLCLCGEC